MESEEFGSAESRVNADESSQLSGAEALLLAIVAELAIVATCSLATAHAHHHSLSAVVITSLIATAGLAVAVRRWGGRVRISGPGRGTLVALAITATVAGLMFLPGFSYGVSDKDPGGYVAHAVEIAHHGSYSFIDPALAHHDGLPVERIAPKVRLNAIWVRNLDTGLIVPQFYHLWPALMATAYDVAGFGGITTLTPLLGMLSVLLLVLLVRRVTRSPVAALLVGLLAATNMLQVWQSRLPSTEVLAEAFFVGALLCLVIALQERYRPAAGLAGVLTGVSFLNRADAWLLVMMGVGGLAALWVLRRFDGRAMWFGAGLLLVVPYAFWQAYAAAVAYSVDNAVPSMKKTVILISAVAGLAVVLRPLTGRAVRRLDQLATDPMVQRRVGWTVLVLAVFLLLLGFARPLLFGKDVFPNYHGGHVRSYDEDIVARLSWFITLPGFALALAGLGVACLRRWSATVWVALLPPLILLPIFTVHARISTQLMWWGRRYVPYALPVFLLLMGLAVAFAVSWRYRGKTVLRLPALITVAGILAIYLLQSAPLRHHDEWAGSFGVTGKVAALSGGRHGIFLWPNSRRGTPGALFAIPVWLERDQLSVLTPETPSAFAPYVLAYQRAFPDQPLFVVRSDDTGPPPAVPGLAFTEVGHFSGSLPYWDESNSRRPDQPHPGGLGYAFTVYQATLRGA